MASTPLPWKPLHGGEGGESKYGLNPELQAFLDSDFGVTLALLLHTVGIFVYVAGLAFAGYRIAQRSEATPFRRTDLERARSLAWGGLAGNLLGGFMRLAQSDHPTLASLSTSAWVQFIFTKHLAWIGLVVVTYQLLKRVLPRFVDAPDHHAPTAARARRSILVASLGVLVISVLGAAASTAGIRLPMAGNPDHPPDDPHDHPPQPGTFSVGVSGQLTGTPGNPDSRDVTVDIPANATRITVAIAWTGSGSTLTLELRDPSGQPRGTPETSPTSARVTWEKPVAGLWTVTVASERAVQETYSGNAVVDYLA